ncbi:MAG: hypothetical protein AAB393_09200 [Bacteroidota bacterium]
MMRVIGYTLLLLWAGACTRSHTPSSIPRDSDAVPGVRVLCNIEQRDAAALEVKVAEGNLHVVQGITNVQSSELDARQKKLGSARVSLEKWDLDVKKHGHRHEGFLGD